MLDGWSESQWQRLKTKKRLGKVFETVEYPGSNPDNPVDREMDGRWCRWKPEGSSEMFFFFFETERGKGWLCLRMTVLHQGLDDEFLINNAQLRCPADSTSITQVFISFGRSKKASMEVMCMSIRLKTYPNQLWILIFCGGGGGGGTCLDQSSRAKMRGLWQETRPSGEGGEIPQAAKAVWHPDFKLICLLNVFHWSWCQWAGNPKRP
jgi:hypothetical protein